MPLPPMRTTLLRSTTALFLLIGLPTAALAQGTPSFTDVPANHPAFESIEFLKAQGILQGYADGTFKPNQKVNRAEATKIIVAPLVPANQLAALTATVYTDIPVGAWYIPFTEAARQKLAIIDGPPKTATFNGTRAVNKAEFLKILLLANKETPDTTYSEFKAPLATDVVNPDEWFYPFVRLALASSMIQVGTDGTLQPGAELTRADVAQMMHRYIMYKQGRRTQALLSEAESEIVNVLQQLDVPNLDQANFASARALLASRGALTTKPDEAVVKGAVKVSEGFRTLVFAYVAGAAGQLDEAIKLSGDAWHLAEKAREFSPSLNELATQMQAISKTMADEARTLQTQ